MERICSQPGLRSHGSQGWEKELPRGGPEPSTQRAVSRPSCRKERGRSAVSINTIHRAARSGHSLIPPKPKAASRTPGPAALQFALEPALAQPRKRRAAVSLAGLRARQAARPADAFAPRCASLILSLAASTSPRDPCVPPNPAGSQDTAGGHVCRQRGRALLRRAYRQQVGSWGTAPGLAAPLLLCSNSTVPSARDRGRQQTVAAAAQPPDNLQPVALAKSFCVPDAPPNSHPRSQRVVVAKLGWTGAGWTTRKPFGKLPAHLSVTL